MSPITDTLATSASTALLSLAWESLADVGRRLVAFKFSEMLCSSQASMARVSAKIFKAHGLATLFLGTWIRLANRWPHCVVLSNAACGTCDAATGAEAALSRCTRMTLTTFRPQIELDGHRESRAVVRLASTNAALF